MATTKRNSWQRNSAATMEPARDEHEQLRARGYSVVPRVLKQRDREGDVREHCDGYVLKRLDPYRDTEWFTGPSFSWQLRWTAAEAFTDEPTAWSALQAWLAAGEGRPTPPPQPTCIAVVADVLLIDESAPITVPSLELTGDAARGLRRLLAGTPGLTQRSAVEGLLRQLGV